MLLYFLGDDVPLEDKISNSWNGIVVYFSGKVQKSKSEFQIDVQTMLSMLGGIVGCCKEMFWLIVLILSALSFFERGICGWINK